MTPYPETTDDGGSWREDALAHRKVNHYTTLPRYESTVEGVPKIMRKYERQESRQVYHECIRQHRMVATLASMIGIVRTG